MILYLYVVLIGDKMRYAVFSAFVLLLMACGQAEQSQETSKVSEQLNQPIQADQIEPKLDASEKGEYQTVEWVELMPEEDLEALLNPPEYLYDIADGSIEDQIASNIQNAYENQNGRYEQALISTDIVEAMDGKAIRIPGFVVPVEFDQNQQVLSFFLVPFFGACIHSPPPPPNQIIYVESDAGFKLGSLYEPIWVSGKLTAEMFEDQLATSAYSLKMELIEAFDESY